MTAIGLTVTPLLAAAGRRIGREVDRNTETVRQPITARPKGRTVIFGFGRVGRMVADMLIAAQAALSRGRQRRRRRAERPRKRGTTCSSATSRRPELADKLQLGHAAALVLTMDDPVLVAQIARRAARLGPDLPIIARARDTDHAAQLYRAGVTDAVPETLEASLQLSEAVLVDVGVAMGPVIASIHEKRDELRAEIKAEAELEVTPRLGRRRGTNAEPIQR